MGAAQGELNRQLHRQCSHVCMVFVDCKEFGLMKVLWSSFVDIDMCKGVDCFLELLFVGFGALLKTTLPCSVA